MGIRALSVSVALTLFALAGGATLLARAEPDPFEAMSALRVIPRAPSPDVTFQRLDGRQVRLDSFRGKPVLLTFFTTW